MLISEQDLNVSIPAEDQDGGVTLLCTIRTHGGDVWCSVPPVHILPDARRRYVQEVNKRGLVYSAGDPRLHTPALSAVSEGDLPLKRVALVFLRKYSKEDFSRHDWPGDRIPLTLDSMNEVLDQLTRELDGAATG